MYGSWKRFRDGPIILSVNNTWESDDVLHTDVDAGHALDRFFFMRTVMSHLASYKFVHLTTPQTLVCATSPAFYCLLNPVKRSEKS
jgi:hypothetical protein